MEGWWAPRGPSPGWAAEPRPQHVRPSGCWGSPVLGSRAEGDGVLGLARKLQVVPEASSSGPVSLGPTRLDPALRRQRGKNVPNCQGKPSSAPEWKVQILYLRSRCFAELEEPAVTPANTVRVQMGYGCAEDRTRPPDRLGPLPGVRCGLTGPRAPWLPWGWLFPLSAGPWSGARS